MKTITIKSAGILLCMVVVAGLCACTDDIVERKGGKLPDKEPLENTYGSLNSTRATEREVDILLTKGTAGVATDRLYYQITQPVPAGVSLDLRADLSEETLNAFNVAREAELGPTEYVPYVLLPEANYELPDGKTLDISQDGKRSESKRVKILAKDLTAGFYLLPFTVTGSEQQGEKQTLYYTITVREPQLGDEELHNGDDLFFVFYINTSQYQPLLVDDYFMRKKLARGATVKWYNLVGNIINLRTVRLDYEAKTGRAKLNLGADMQYVLNHYTKYISPLQDKGRKVCISIEGGGSGLGFCNLTDAQIADFAAQVKAVIESYGLDGINLWDRNSSYGKEGMPAVNTTSYPRLIKALREALGAEKLLTVTVYGQPTESFSDTEATGGIAVGDYIDYAWSGYNSNEESPQILDPWHPELEYVSAYTQKPIANLPKEHYGCVNFPMYSNANKAYADESILSQYFIDWVKNQYQPNKIIVFDDLRTILQDEYETVWDLVYGVCCTFMDAENKYIWGSKAGYTYTFDKSRALEILPNGKGGYGKWLKDW